jgi:hypothetical protein
MDLSELKKNHNTSYLAGELERLAREEAEVREMLAGDETLHELVAKELKTLQEEKERIEKQIQDILDKDREADEFPNEIVLEVRAGAGGDEASLFAWELAHMYEKFAEVEGWQWKTKKMLTELYAIQQKHYELDGDDNQESLAVASLQYAILKFSEDSARLGLFSLLVDNWQSSSEVSKHFSVLAPLEQYTKTDFKFKDAELISKYYPEGLEKLQSTRTFYKNFYLAVKDLASDDLKSAAYKFSRLGEDEAKMKGIDFLAILKSRKDQNAKQKQEIVQNMLKEYTLAKQLLGQVHGVKTAWNEGDLACAMVLYKTSAYDAVKDQYPDVDSVEQLYTLLEELSPSLAPVEQVIKQHVAVRKDDKRIYVNCKSLGMEFSHQREDKSSEK